ncbi:MAG TPA: serine hydrolase [candidate division Zixibacteria bacterium]|nr:serine hydrolase [candidate division Zixibacteria bacterium]
MIVRRSTLPKVLLFLAAFVFFSANTVYFLEADTGALTAAATLNNDTYHFDFDHLPDSKPYLNTKAAILVDYDNGQVLYAKGADEVRPIASISKLVTAMVVIDNNVDLNKEVSITKEDAHRSSRSRLRVGYRFKVLDLMYCALLNSDNRAARALARATSGTYEDFAKEMNRKVKQLGLKNSCFYEPTGLDKRNVSTAHEVAKILHYAYEYPLIKKITSTKRARVKVANRKRTYIQLANTNLLIYSPYKVLSGKTGYIRAADYCLTSLVKNKAGERLTLVVLGVPGDRLRFRVARKLIDWGYRQI